MILVNFTGDFCYKNSHIIYTNKRSIKLHEISIQWYLSYHVALLKIENEVSGLRKEKTLEI